MNSLVESIGKSEFRIMYNNTLCEFIPSPNCSLDEIPDTVKGKVVYVNIGEYNPLGWFHDVIVNKEDIIYTPNFPENERRMSFPTRYREQEC